MGDFPHICTWYVTTARLQVVDDQNRLSAQPHCFPIPNLPASSPDGLAQKSYFSSRLTHAQNSLFRLPLQSSRCFSRAYIFMADLIFLSTLSSLVTRFSATNSVVFAQYTLSLFNLPITGFNQSVFAIGGVTFCAAGSGSKQSSASFSHLVLAVAISTKWSLRAVNILSVFKVLSLVW